MGVKILFTQDENSGITPFREHLEQLFLLKGNLLILTTGFVLSSQFTKNKSYLLDLIDKGFQKSNGRYRSHSKIIFVVGAVYDRCEFQQNHTHKNTQIVCDQCLKSLSHCGNNCNFCNSQQFIKDLQNYFQNKVDVEVIRAPMQLDRKWHGKLALKVNTTEPPKQSVIAGLVGSSNLTTPTLTNNVYDSCSMECDIFACNKRYLTKTNKDILKEIEKENKNRISTSLFPRELNVKLQDISIDEFLYGLLEGFLKRVYGKIGLSLIKNDNVHRDIKLMQSVNIKQKPFIDSLYNNFEGQLILFKNYHPKSQTDMQIEFSVTSNHQIEDISLVKQFIAIKLQGEYIFEHYSNSNNDITINETFYAIIRYKNNKYDIAYITEQEFDRRYLV